MQFFQYSYKVANTALKKIKIDSYRVVNTVCFSIKLFAILRLLVRYKVTTAMTPTFSHLGVMRVSDSVLLLLLADHSLPPRPDSLQARLPFCMLRLLPEILPFKLHFTWFIGARKRSRSSCQKCRWQVTAKHACTLRMWLCMK